MIAYKLIKEARKKIKKLWPEYNTNKIVTLCLILLVILSGCSGKFPETFESDIIQVTVFNSSWFKEGTKITEFPDLYPLHTATTKALCMTGEDCYDRKR